MANVFTNKKFQKPNLAFRVKVGLPVRLHKRKAPTFTHQKVKNYHIITTSKFIKNRFKMRKKHHFQTIY